jgi:hypothetical protein
VQGIVHPSFGELGSIVVPDISSVALVHRAARVLGEGRIREEFEDWDFLDPSDCGATFDFLPLNFGRLTNTFDVCAAHLERGFDGHTAALISLILNGQVYGWCTSIPSRRSRLWKGKGDNALHAACSTGSDIFLTRIRDRWSSCWTHYGFRRRI